MQLIRSACGIVVLLISQMAFSMHQATKLVLLMQQVRCISSFSNKCVACPGSVKDWCQKKLMHEIAFYEKIFVDQKNVIKMLSDDEGSALINQNYTGFVPFTFQCPEPRLQVFNAYFAEKKHADAADIGFGFYSVSKKPIEVSVASLIVTNHALQKSHARFMTESIATIVRRNYVTDKRINAYRDARRSAAGDERLNDLAYAEGEIDCRVYEELLYKYEQLLVLSRLYPQEREIYLNALVKNTFPLEYKGFTTDELHIIANDLNHEDDGFCVNHIKKEWRKRYIRCKEGKEPESLLKSLRNKIEE